MAFVAKLKDLYYRDGFQKYLKNTSWLFLEKLLRIFAGLLVGSWVGRYLGPADYGAFQFSISIISIFAAVSTLGIDQIVIRELVKDESRRDVLLGTSFVLKLIGAIVSFAILFFSLPLSNYELVVNRMILIIGSTMLFNAFNVIDFHFQSKVLSKYVVFANIISLLIISITKVILILSNAPLIAFAIVTAFDVLVLTLGYIYYYSVTAEALPILKWRYDKKLAKALLTDSWPLIFSSIVIILQARIDQVMLKELISNEEVGYYTASLRLIEMLGFIPVLLQSSLFPSLVNSRRVSIALYKSRLLNYYRLNFLFFLLTAIPIFFLSDWIVLFLYGEEYAPAIPLLAFMTSRIVLANMGVARASFINIENLFKFSMITMIIGTVANIVLNYYWIPKHYSMGAILATIISFSITTFFVDLFYSKTRENALMQFKSMFTFYAIKLDFLKSEEDAK